MPWISNYADQVPTWKENLNWSLCVCSKLLNSFDVKLLTSRGCRILYLGEYLDDRRSSVSFINFQHYFTTWIISVCKAVMKICKPRLTVLLTLCLLWWKKKSYLTHISKYCLAQANRISASSFSISSFKETRHSEKILCHFFFLAVSMLSWLNPGTHWMWVVATTYLELGRKRLILLFRKEYNKAISNV